MGCDICHQTSSHAVKDLDAGAGYHLLDQQGSVSRLATIGAWGVFPLMEKTHLVPPIR